MAFVRCSGGKPTPAYIGLPELAGSITLYQQLNSNDFACPANAIFEFDANYTTVNTFAQLQVYVYYNGAWVLLQQLSGVNTTGVRHYTIPLTAYIGNNIKLRVKYNDNDSYAGCYTSISNAIVTN